MATAPSEPLPRYSEAEMNDKTEIGRLAFRHEGEWWNAYWTPDQHSMKRALLLGSVRMSAVMLSAPAKETFMAAMQSVFDGIVHDIMNQNPSWRGPTRAPESERSGHS